LIKEGRLVSLTRSYGRFEVRQRHLAQVPGPLLRRNDSVLADLCDHEPWMKIHSVGAQSARVLQKEDVLGPYLPKALDPNILEDVACKDWPMVHDLVAPRSVKAAPIRSTGRPGVFEVMRHAYCSLRRMERRPSSARKTSKSER